MEDVTFLEEIWECLKQWAHEIHYVSCVVGEALPVELSTIETEDKESQSTFEGIRAAREATRSASQACQIVTQFCIVSFHRVGIGLAFRDFISAKVVPKPLIGIKAIGVIPLGFWRLIHNVLQGSLAAGPDDRPAQNTARFAVYKSNNIDFGFLSPMKVNISSISASFTSLGNGAWGKASATSVTQ